jgi:hypothetical protein
VVCWPSVRPMPAAYIMHHTYLQYVLNLHVYTFYIYTHHTHIIHHQHQTKTHHTLSTT